MLKLKPSLPFIYALVDPLEPKHIRYVGMSETSINRPYEHAMAARCKSQPAWHVIKIADAMIGRDITWKDKISASNKARWKRKSGVV